MYLSYPAPNPALVHQPPHAHTHVATRIAIIDPQRTKAELLLNCCSTEWGYSVVALEHSGQAGLAAVARTRPEVVLISAHLSDIAPWDFIRRLRSIVPTAKGILLTQHCSEFLVYHAGAVNFHGMIWELEEGMMALGHVIERVKNGLRVISSGIAQLQNSLRDAHDSFAKLLSNRHFEVLICITHCLSDQEIAAHLGFSTSTALGHRRQIMRKLNIHKTPKLIRYGLEKGFGMAPLPLKHDQKTDTYAV